MAKPSARWLNKPVLNILRCITEVRKKFNIMTEMVHRLILYSIPPH